VPPVRPDQKASQPQPGASCCGRRIWGRPALGHSELTNAGQPPESCPAADTVDGERCCFSSSHDILPGTPIPDVFEQRTEPHGNGPASAQCQRHQDAPGLAEWRRTAAGEGGPGRARPASGGSRACKPVPGGLRTVRLPKGDLVQGDQRIPSSDAAGGVVQLRPALVGWRARPCVVWSLPARWMRRQHGGTGAGHEPAMDEMFAGAIRRTRHPAKRAGRISIVRWRLAMGCLVRAETRAPAGDGTSYWGATPFPA